MKRTRLQMEGVKPTNQVNGTTVYADDKEQMDMAECSASCIAILKEHLQKLNGHCRGAALDVAGGDGRLSKGLLIDEYQSVDLFDRCHEGISKAAEALS